MFRFPLENSIPVAPWACEPSRLAQMTALRRAMVGAPGEASRREPLAVNPHGIALIQLRGVLSKGRSWLGGTPTLLVRNQLRAALARDDVRAVLLVVDSPGGTVDGTADLADDVAAAAQRKPVEAYIEDIGASAAYWVASQARKVWANRTALIGSIGATTVVWDESRAYDAAGIKVHVVATGPLKGAGTPGTELSDEWIASERRIVTSIGRQFVADVARGRRLTGKRLDAVSSGSVWIAPHARALGLIDGIDSLDHVADVLAARGEAAAARGSASLRLLELRNRIQRCD